MGDFKRYDRLMAFLEKSYNFFGWFNYSSEPSLYKLSYVNPLNMIPVPWLTKLYGISDDFFNLILTPINATSFMTNDITNMVGSILYICDEVVPCTPKPPTDMDPEGRKTPRLNTWKDGGNGIKKLYGNMTKDATVKTNTRVLKVKADQQRKQVVDEFGQVAEFDRVVFACPSNAVGNMLEGHSWIEDTLMRTSEYADDFDFVGGHLNAVVHEDGTVLPAPVRNPVLQYAANYIEVNRDPQTGKWRYENTYTFGAQTYKTRDLPLSERPPMLITHGLFDDKKSIDPNVTHRSESHARAHTIYSAGNLITMFMLHLIQGRRGVYYCSNYTIAGNCQDLGSVSGMAAAHAIGAAYPLNDRLAERDFNTMRGLMGL